MVREASFPGLDSALGADLDCRTRLKRQAVKPSAPFFMPEAIYAIQPVVTVPLCRCVGRTVSRPSHDSDGQALLHIYRKRLGLTGLTSHPPRGGHNVEACLTTPTLSAVYVSMRRNDCCLKTVNPRSPRRQRCREPKRWHAYQSKTLNTKTKSNPTAAKPMKIQSKVAFVHGQAKRHTTAPIKHSTTSPLPILRSHAFRGICCIGIHLQVLRRLSEASPKWPPNPVFSPSTLQGLPRIPKSSPQHNPHLWPRLQVQYPRSP